MSLDKNSIRGFLQAAEAGDLRKLESYLKKLSVNEILDEQSQSALHYAAANGHLNAVRYLVTKGAALDHANWCGWTPLMYASYYGHTNVVSYLIENKAEINVFNSRLVTPLICAARCGHKAVIEILLEHAAQIDPKEIKIPPISQEFKTLAQIEMPEVATLQQPKLPMTALMAAAQHGHLGIVSLLVQYGSPIDYQNSVNGYTALMLSAMNGHIKIVEFLVETGGADANIVNYRNQTAFILSILRRRSDVETYLSSRTLVRVPETPKQFPPIIIAAKSGFISFYFKKNLNVNVYILYMLITMKVYFFFH